MTEEKLTVENANAEDDNAAEQLTKAQALLLILSLGVCASV